MSMPSVRALSTLAILGVLMAGGCKSTSREERADVKEAVKVEEAKPIDPSAALHVSAGDLALSQNHPDEAATQYRKALDKDPHNAAAMFKLASMLAYAKQFDASIDMWKRYAAETNNSSEALSNLGRTYELSGQWREAEANYVASLKRDPKNTTSRVNYGILLAKRDRVDEAELQLSQALVPAEVQYNLGSVSELKGDLAAARTRYTRAIALDPRLVAAKQRLDALNAPTSSSSLSTAR